METDDFFHGRLMKGCINMALWQYEFYIIPREYDKKTDSKDELISWEGVNILLDIDGFFANFLPLSDSWSKHIRIYGKNDGTCVRIFLDGNNIVEILCRLDLRNLTKKMLENIVTFVKTIKGVIWVNGSVHEPELNSIISDIKNSEAMKFCANPFGFFDEKM